MIKINLVPRELLDQEVQKQRTIQAAVAMGLIIAVVAGVSAIQIRKAAALQAKSVELQKEFDRLQAIAAEADELEKQAKAVRAKLDVITSLLKGRGLYPIFMMDFSRTLPGAVWIVVAVFMVTGSLWVVMSSLCGKHSILVPGLSHSW